MARAVAMIRCGLILTAGLLSSLAAYATAPDAGEKVPQEVKEEPMEGAPSLGLEPRSIRLSAAGYMLDFRYRVTSAERAGQVINKAIQPYLIDEATGARVGVPAPPKIGPLRHTGNNLASGRTYFILFANPARRIKSGDRVTVVLGEHQVEGLIVQ